MPTGTGHGRRSGTRGTELVQEFRHRSEVPPMPEVKPRRSPALPIAAALVVVAAGAAFFVLGRGTPTPQQPDVARELDRLVPGTTVAAKAAFNGSCKGAAGTFEISGEAIRYGNGSRT